MSGISALKIRPGLHLTFGLLLLSVGLTTGTRVCGAWSGDPSLVTWQGGPKTVSLKQMATLQLPAGFRFADAHSTIRVLQAANRPVTKREMGMIISDDGSDWAIIFKYGGTGHLSESGAASLDANEMLKTLNRNIESANAEAKKTGKPALSKFTWEQKPVYRNSSHSLEWALRTETQGKTNIEYHLDFLGRQGVMEAELACDVERFNALFPTIKEMLGSYSFVPGQKYSDQTIKSKIARGDLEGLITGETVKLEGRLGFWATVLLILKTLLSWIIKLLVLAAIIAVVGGGYFFYKLYSGGKYKKAGAAPE